MKASHYFLLTLFVVLLSLATRCNNVVNNNEGLGPLQPTNVDANAGTWTPIYVSSYSKYGGSVPAPTDTSSTAYKAELSSIKNLQSTITQSQRDVINYWSDGGVLRWNQIFRELVARYNLAPAPLSNNTYPAPDPNNPFADPQFPFANPPYAARAFSYVSVAIYDALKAAWFFKYKYNRPSPYLVSKGIKSLMPDVNIPSYPSEEAVMSGVAQTILQSMFPAAGDEILTKAGQQRAAALQSGKASSSDISAGLALGKAVAQDFLTRASSDGMSTAVGTQPQWQALGDSAKLHWSHLLNPVPAADVIPWVSLDLPSRPPMLPFFGTKTSPGVGVMGWMMSASDFVNVRPGPPPVATSDSMKSQLAETKYYSEHLTREREGTVLKWADGIGTFTPPGHWNQIAETYVRDAHFSEVRAARAFALLNMALHDAGVGCWECKYYYYNPRPTQLDASVKTGTGIPNFPSYASGHSTFSAAAATVLAYLFPSNADYFNGQAEEAALSRLYAGIHYRIDCEVGLSHGEIIGGYTTNFAKNDGAD